MTASIPKPDTALTNSTSFGYSSEWGSVFRREVDAHTMLMRVFYGCLQLVEREVSGCGAHTEVVAGEVYRVGAVEYRGAQLVGAARR